MGEGKEGYLRGGGLKKGGRERVGGIIKLYTYIYIGMHTYIHTYIHTHIYIHIWGQVVIVKLG